MILKWKFVGTLALALAISPVFAAGKEDKKGYTYLALGDSIPFGFDPTKFIGVSTLPKPGDFVGYAELVANTLFQGRVVNAACPGETSASFIVVGAPDNGCNGLGPDGQLPFKTSIGLKADYKGWSQLKFALRELSSNKSIKLVTLSLGGNDLSLLQKLCATPVGLDSDCVLAKMPQVLGMYATNLAMILREIRQGAKYDGDLVLMTTYAPNHDPAVLFAVQQLNLAMSDVATDTRAGFRVKIADGFTAFIIASGGLAGNPCDAGLLIRLPEPGGPNGKCDIHPTLAGQALLANTVLLTQ